MKRRISFVLALLFILFAESHAQNPGKQGENTMETKIVLKANGITIPATLNDTVAAKDFRTRLPFTVSGYRSSVDYCCTASSGAYDPKETQAGWKNGDINLGGGWFAVLFDGEESSKSYTEMMIIGHIDEEHLHLVKGLPNNVTFTVELAE